MPNKQVDIVRPDTASASLSLPAAASKDLKLSATPSVDFSQSAIPSINVSIKNTQVPDFLPIITGVPTVSGTAQVGQVLTANAASVSARPPSTRVFRWQRSDNGTSGWTTIQDSNTYTVALADEQKYIRVQQRETNTVGTTVANSASTSQVPLSFQGLLDNYGQNIGAAYSVRRLSSTYDGNCMEIRRDSDNATQNIGFSNNVLDTSAIATFCSGTNGYVRTWYDQSGNDKNVQQTTASKQPRIYYDGSVVTLNSKPALDGYVDDGVNSADQVLQVVESGSVDLETTGFDIFTVMKFNGTYGFGVSKIPSTNNDRTLFFNGQVRITIDGNNRTFSKPSGQIDLNNTQFLSEFNVDNDTIQPYINGSTYGETKSIPNGSAFNFNAIGTNNNIRSFEFMQEVLIYTDNQQYRSEITSNINDHFNIYS